MWNEDGLHFSPLGAATSVLSGGREVGGGLWIPGVIKVGADEFLG